MKIYLVKQGDTCEGIANKHSIDVKKLREMNPQIKDSEQIPVGTKIILAKTTKMCISSSTDGLHKYIVQQGDTLWKLSKNWGVTLQSLIELNQHVKNPNVLLTNEIIYTPSITQGTEPQNNIENLPSSTHQGTSISELGSGLSGSSVPTVSSYSTEVPNSSHGVHASQADINLTMAQGKHQAMEYPYGCDNLSISESDTPMPYMMASPMPYMMGAPMPYMMASPMPYMMAAPMPSMMAAPMPYMMETPMSTSPSLCTCTLQSYSTDISSNSYVGLSSELEEKVSDGESHHPVDLHIPYTSCERLYAMDLKETMGNPQIESQQVAEVANAMLPSVTTNEIPYPSEYVTPALPKLDCTHQPGVEQLDKEDSLRPLKDFQSIHIKEVKIKENNDNRTKNKKKSKMNETRHISFPKKQSKISKYSQRNAMPWISS